MQFEYQVLISMTFFHLFAWLPSSFAKGQTFGLKWLAGNREPVPGKTLEGWGARAERAYNNLKDNFPAFVVAVIVLGQLGKFDHTTSWAVGLYALGRLLHFISYTAGNFPMRFISFVLAINCNVFLLAKALL